MLKRIGAILAVDRDLPLRQPVRRQHILLPAMILPPPRRHQCELQYRNCRHSPRRFLHVDNLSSGVQIRLPLIQVLPKKTVALLHQARCLLSCTSG